MYRSTPQPNSWPLPTLLDAESRPTWDAWLEWQARHTPRPRGRAEPAQLTDRERARLRFHRWLYESGRLAG